MEIHVHEKVKAVYVVGSARGEAWSLFHGQPEPGAKKVYETPKPYKVEHTPSFEIPYAVVSVDNGTVARAYSNHQAEKIADLLNKEEGK